MSWRPLSHLTEPMVAGARRSRDATEAWSTSWSNVMWMGAAVETSIVLRCGASPPQPVTARPTRRAAAAKVARPFLGPPSPVGPLPRAKPTWSEANLKSIDRQPTLLRVYTKRLEVGLEARPHLLGQLFQARRVDEQERDAGDLVDRRLDPGERRVRGAQDVLHLARPVSECFL